MKLERLAEQAAHAQQRIVDVAQAITGQQNLDPALADAIANVSERNPNVRALRRNEAVAAFLEALAGEKAIDVSEGLTERLEAISGVGPKLAAEIAAALKDG